MRPSFNVLTEPWITVVTQGGQTETLGISETLKRAHELQSISDVSPLAEYGIHRLLTLFLMDALRPEDITDLEDMLEEGSFSPEAIDAYIDLCRSEGVSFDLFDEERPFLQSAYDPEYDKEKKPVTTLDCTLPTGNNHTHYDHRKPNEVFLSASESVRVLITAQLFCTSGTAGPSNVSASPPYYAVIQGENLFETLVYELTPINEINIPFDEPPVLWRSREKVQGKKNVSSTSWLRGGFFPTRRILLLPREDRHISEAYCSPGENYTEKTSWRDSALTYLEKDGEIAPLRPHKDMPLWRNLDSLVDIPGKHAPKILRQYRELSQNQYARITLYGVETKQASYLNIMRSDLRLPMELCADSKRIEWLATLLSDSAQVATGLRIAVALLSEKCVGSAADAYYASCEALLWEYCEKAADCALTDLPKLRGAWLESISEQSLRCLQGTISALHLRGRELAKAADAQKSLYIAINKLKKEAEK